MLGLMEKAATTAQQLCFSTKFALRQKPPTQNRGGKKKKKNLLFVYYLLWGTDFIPGPRVPVLHVRTYHLQARPSGLEASEQTPRVTEEGTGEKTAQAGTELRLQCLQKNRRQ